MAEETAVVASSPIAATPKKKAKNATGKPKNAPPSHPKVSEMKYMDRLTPFIRKFLKSAVAGGTLVQTKGKGANGSFKLNASGQKQKNPKSREES
ncbi:histone H1, orphon [Caerostris extrusa]|uniref:Histone H1, orphon n=1 Tax=Caerostris extrusa TaxID=172846 RepID=A0AAV4MNK7_CAEEX|nr:histone H1, orphon [Caerostris extrusa]